MMRLSEWRGWGGGLRGGEGECERADVETGFLRSSSCFWQVLEAF